MTIILFRLRTLLRAVLARSGGSRGLRRLRAVIATWVAAWCFGSAVAAAASMPSASEAISLAEQASPQAERGAGQQAAQAVPEAASQPAAGPSEAPMCDPMGASVAARPEMDLPLLDRGRLEELPCDALMLLRRGELSLDSQHEAVESDSERPSSPTRDIERTQSEGACRLVQADHPRRHEPSRIAAAAKRGLMASPGHGQAVYRPPVAAR